MAEVKINVIIFFLKYLNQDLSLKNWLGNPEGAKLSDSSSIVKSFSGIIYIFLFLYIYKLLLIHHKVVKIKILHQLVEQSKSS